MMENIFDRFRRTNSRYAVGDEIETLGGVIGKIVELRPKYVTVLTNDEHERIQYVHNAIVAVNGVSLAIPDGLKSAR